MHTDGVLYHYTNAEGFLGIFSSGTLWASDAAYLNDPSELKYAREALPKVVKELADPLVDRWWSSSPLDPERRRDTASAGQEEIQAGDAYVLSFGYSDKALGMWRSYAGRHGFCIGFDRETLMQALGGSPSEFSPASWCECTDDEHQYQSDFPLSWDLVRVGYGKDAVRNLAVGLAKENAEQGEIRRGGSWADLLALASVKHPAFREEGEVRIVMTAKGCIAPNPKVRVSPSFGLIPYQVAHFPPCAIKSVTYAPGADAVLARQALSSLFAQGNRGSRPIEIRGTGIPYVW